MGIMAMFIASFVAVGFVGLTWAIIYELKQEVRLIAQEEVDEQVAIYKLRGNLLQDPEHAVKDGIHGSKGRIFCYILDTNQNLVAAEEPIKVLRNGVLEKIQHWDVAEDKVSINRIVLPDEETAAFIMTARQVYHESQWIGTVYLGKDVTEYYHVLKMLLFILISGTLLCLIIASGAGHYISGKAMIPINQSFARQREFVADASHELRTPLTVLLASVDVVQADEDNKISAFSGQILHDMKDEIRKMTKIVSDLLTLARADAGVLEVLKEIINIPIMTRQVIRLLQTRANEKKITLVLEGSENLQIYADRARISQLLFILIDNAIKYTPLHGEVKVQLASVDTDGPKLKIMVQDTGVGIAAEYQPMIFERFYRVDKIRSREAGGTGLGLAIARWIVEVHGGVIQVKSEVGKGSIFTVLLPI
jgi:signal transduction histidine kinase